MAELQRDLCLEGHPFTPKLRAPAPCLLPTLQFALRGFGLSAYEVLRKHNVRVRIGRLNRQGSTAGRCVACSGAGFAKIAAWRGPGF